MRGDDDLEARVVALIERVKATVRPENQNARVQRDISRRSQLLRLRAAALRGEL